MTTTPIPGRLSQYADSYGGIVAALVELRVRQGLAYKAYDPNFAGIIEAIRDLAIIGDTDWGELPPGWDVNPDTGEGDFQYPPKNGSLWFDERQGRLFIWIDDGYYQTNGNDGLTAVGTVPPEEEVIGATWYNPSNGALYVYDGTQWNLIDMAGTLTTEDMSLHPLTVSLGCSVDSLVISPYTVEEGQPATQGNLNRWIIRRLVDVAGAINEHINDQTTYTSSTTPSSAQEGDLWFNTSDLNLYVYYTDNDSSQWVPAFSLINNYDFNSLEEAITNLSTSTAQQITELSEEIDALPISSLATNVNLESTRSTLQGSIDSLVATVGDLDRFATQNDLADTASGINTRVNQVEASIPNITNLASITALNDAIATLTGVVNSNYVANVNYVESKAEEVKALIPDVTVKANLADLQEFIQQAASTLLTH